MAYVKNNNQELNINEKIMGIDQSFSNTGICIVENDSIIHSASISTKNNKSIEERINDIVKFILLNIKEYNVKQVVIEGLSYCSRQSSIVQLSGLFYCILLNLNKKRIKYQVVPPLTLKKEIAGTGKATKQDMIDSISEENQLKLSQLSKIKIGSKKYEDIADSYCLAIFNKIKQS